MEAVLEHVIEKMELSTSDFQVLITDSALHGQDNKAKRVRRCEILFEEFHAKGVHVASQSVLCVLSSGKSTGVAVSLGHSVFQVVPVYEGYAVAPAGRTLDICATNIDRYMGRLMHEEGCNIDQGSHWLRMIKEELTSVSLDWKAEYQGLKASDYEKSITLPNGQQFTISDAQFRAPEILFFQSINCPKYSNDGIVDYLVESVQKCPSEFRSGFYENIVLDGGSSKFPGLTARFEKDLKALVPEDTKFSVNCPPNPELAVWRGSCMLAKSEAFKDMVFTKEEYACAWLSAGVLKSDHSSQNFPLWDTNYWVTKIGYNVVNRSKITVSHAKIWY